MTAQSTIFSRRLQEHFWQGLNKISMKSLLPFNRWMQTLWRECIKQNSHKRLRNVRKSRELVARVQNRATGRSCQGIDKKSACEKNELLLTSAVCSDLSMHESVVSAREKQEPTLHNSILHSQKKGGGRVSKRTEEGYSPALKMVMENAHNNSDQSPEF